MCTNKRHTKNTYETKFKNEGFNDLTSTKKEDISNCMNFIFTERHTIYKFLPSLVLECQQN